MKNLKGKKEEKKKRARAFKSRQDRNAIRSTQFDSFLKALRGISDYASNFVSYKSEAVFVSRPSGLTYTRIMIPQDGFTDKDFAAMEDAINGR